MKAPELISTIRVLFDMKRPVFVRGSSGIGKSDLFEQICLDIQNEIKEPFPLITVSAILKNPVDANGMPRIIDNKNFPEGITVFTRPGYLPYEGRGCLFFDELTQADSDVQKAYFSLFLKREIEGHKLGDGYVLAAAGNLPSDKAATHPILAPLANRMAHLLYEADVAAWCAWAARNDRIDPLFVAYHRFRIGAGRPTGDINPLGMLHRFDPKSPDPAWPSPRTWAEASDAKKYCEEHNLGIEMEARLIASHVGEDAANDFYGFVNLVKSGFDADDIINNPKTALVSNDPAVNYAITAFLARSANLNNFSNLFEYAERMGEEYLVAMVLDATAVSPVLCSTELYKTEFALKYKDVIA